MYWELKICALTIERRAPLNVRSLVEKGRSMYTLCPFSLKSGGSGTPVKYVVPLCGGIDKQKKHLLLRLRTMELPNPFFFSSAAPILILVTGSHRIPA